MMTTHATGTFELKGWDEKTWDGKDHKEVKGAKLTHAVITQLFHGGVEGESVGHSLMTYNEDGFATIVGLQTIEGSLAGRSGRFIMQSSGTYDPKKGVANMKLTIVPGSGTGELQGIRGQGSYAAVHGDQQPYQLDYELD
jgi:hypothetical protein